MAKQVKFIKKLRNYFEYFIVCSLLGWIYEVIYIGMLEQNMGFVNRGFLFGPWLPIYGFGILIVLGIVRLVKAKKPFTIFIIGTVTVTIAELIGSYIMEKTIGGFLWSYDGMFMNFEGRIALKPDLFLGLLALIGVCRVIPKLNKFQNRFDKNILHNAVVVIIAVLFTADCVLRIFLGSNF